MDLWSHPTSVELRCSADTALAATAAALAARKERLRNRKSRGSRCSAALTKNQTQPSTPVGRRRTSGSQRSGSRVVRSGKKGDKVRVEPLDFEATATVVGPSPASALKGMNVRALRQRARTLGVDEEELTAAVEGKDPKAKLIRLIQSRDEGAVKLPPFDSLQSAESTTVAVSSTSSALKGMSIRALRQRARELGALEDNLTAAIEGSNPKEDVIRLIQKLEQSNPSSGELTQPSAEAEGPQDKAASLETLPAVLRAALKTVQNVETKQGSDSNTDTSCTIIEKQLNRMKQTYIADLSAALAEVESALLDADVSRGAKQMIKTTISASNNTAVTDTSHATSLLESMERMILHHFVLGPLPIQSLVAISQTSRSLLAVVRSPEMQQYWNNHWVRMSLHCPSCAVTLDLSHKSCRFPAGETPHSNLQMERNFQLQWRRLTSGQILRWHGEQLVGKRLIKQMRPCKLLKGAHC